MTKKILYVDVNIAHYTVLLKLRVQLQRNVQLGTVLNAGILQFLLFPLVVRLASVQKINVILLLFFLAYATSF